MLVTRQTDNLLQVHGINEEPCVALQRNFRLDALNMISQPPRQLHRRASIAGFQLYSVGGDIQETGFDFLGRIARSNRVQIGSASTAPVEANTVSFASLAARNGQNDESNTIGTSGPAFQNIHLSHALNFEALPDSHDSDAYVDPDFMCPSNDVSDASDDKTENRENDTDTDGLEDLTKSLMAIFVDDFGDLDLASPFVDDGDNEGGLLAIDGMNPVNDAMSNQATEAESHDKLPREMEVTCGNDRNVVQTVQSDGKREENQASGSSVETVVDSGDSELSSELEGACGNDVQAVEALVPNVPLFNDFDPFKRMPSKSIAFYNGGRRRALSLDHRCRSSLHTIFEN